MNILVTGASGFIGKALIKELISTGHKVKALARKEIPSLPSNVEQIIINDLVQTLLYSKSKVMEIALGEIDIVVHLAAKAHVSSDNTESSLLEYRNVNTLVTLELAKKALQSKVKRFIFLSSVGVMGAISKNPFSEVDKPNPYSVYTKSKLEAEVGLLNLSLTSNLDVVIIRPPLVYGLNAPGNFGKLLRLVKIPIPLPFGNIDNKRSLLALDNLVNFIILCLDLKKSNKAKNQVFLISDKLDISTSDLIRVVAESQYTKPWLFPFPVKWLESIAKIFGREDMSRQLLGSLQIDNSKANDLLGWNPVTTIEHQLKKR
jgi:nucleoside-diphosphate-sugar epimerase